MKYVKVWAVDDSGTCKCPTGADCKRPGKHPVGASWETLELAEYELGPEFNWGLVTGEVNGIIVVDCDVHGDVNGVAALGALGTLPATYTVKTGSGGLHYYLKWPGAAVSNSASKLAPGVDVRGDGGYVLVPPSRNAKGVYTVVSATTIAEAPEWLLQRLTSKPTHLKVVPDAPIDVSPEDIAAARAEVLMMAPAVDGKGGDNQTYLVAATLVNDYALPEEIGFPIFREWNARCQPPWSEKDLIVKYRNGSKYATGKRGVKLAGGLRAAVKEQLDRWRESNLGEAGLGALVKGLERAAREHPIVDRLVLDSLEEMVKAATGLPPRKQGLRGAVQSVEVASNAADREVIIWEQDALASCVDKAERALLKSDVYRRGSETVVPIRGEFKPLDAAAVQYELNKVARIDKFNATSQRYTAINPPHELAAGVLSNTRSSLPEIRGVLACPSLRRDGSVINTRGVDASTGLFLETPMDIAVGETREEALAALGRLSELFRETALVTPVDRSVAMSMLLTPVCHAAYDVSPGHGVTASTPGSGKSYLASVATSVALGGRPSVYSLTNMEESEKRLTAALRSGGVVIGLDNISDPLGGDFLCQVVEQPRVTIRPLGTSTPEVISKRVMVYATGNNLRVAGDSTRRWILARVDTGMEHPENRPYSQNPLKMVATNRPAYVRDALTVVRAHIICKGPTLPRLGSFEDWSDTVRSSLVWLGWADPVASMEAVRAEDPEEVLRSEVVDWMRTQGPGFKRPSEWIALAETAGVEWLEYVAGPKQSGKQFSHWCGRNKDRNVHGFMLLTKRDAHFCTAVYAVRPAAPLL